MKKTLIFIAVILIAGGVFYGVMSQKGDNPKVTPVTKTSQADSSAAPNSIDIKDFSFSDKKLIVKKGTTVTWTNKDDARHDVNPTSGAADFKASELLAKGEKYEFTFNNVGTYTYKCSPHPYMIGSVEVTE